MSDQQTPNPKGASGLEIIFFLLLGGAMVALTIALAQWA